MAGNLWWTTPVGCVAMVVPLSLYVSYRLSDADYRVFYGTPKYVFGYQSELFLIMAAVLGLGTLLPMLWSRRPAAGDVASLTDVQLGVLYKVGTVAFRVTALGYILLAVIGAARGARPKMLLQAIIGQNNEAGTLKSMFAPVAGVTSLTQVGIAYVVIAALLLGYGRSPVVLRRLLIVLVLGLLRSYLLTERLAILELVVPLGLILLTRARRAPGGRPWLNLAPVLALPLLLVIFGAFEYSRSWAFYRTHTTLSFPEFVVNRLAGYYATSYNNGALQMLYRPSGRVPYDSLQAFWTAPGIAQLNLYQRLNGQPAALFFDDLVNQHGNPEFNNPGGLATPIVDFGVLGGAIFFALAGIAIGYAYRSWRAGQPTGLLTYPVLFTGLLELPRYVYWTEGRVFPAFVVLLIVAWLLHQAAPVGA